MATKKIPTTTTATSMAPPSISPRRPTVARMVQNFHLVWLDEGIDEDYNDDCRNSITKLRHVVNTVNTFTDADECIDFITDINEEKTLIIISGAFSQIMIPIVQEISQVLFIFSETIRRGMNNGHNNGLK
jgi:hypothetical protein